MLQASISVSAFAQVIISAQKSVRTSIKTAASAKGNVSVYRNRDIDDVLPSQILEQQFPEFIRTDYPKMVDFAKAYFSFLEQTENGKIDDLKNIDKTSGDYILRLRNEFAFNATEFNFLEDKEFIRYAKYFYASKGTEESIKFLFRVMFDEAVEIDYPSERIFKPSTARWYQERSIKVVIDPILSLPPTDFIGNYLQIRNSTGAEQTIEVSDVLDITDKLTDSTPSTIFEIFFTTELLINVSIGDAVLGTDLSATIIPSLSSLKIISPGTNFRIGQVINLDSITGSGAVAVITNVRENGEIRNVKFLKFGKNYTTNFYLGISPEGVFTDSGSSFVTTGTADINKGISDITEGFLETKSILRSDYVLNNSPVTSTSPFPNYVYSAYTGVYVSQSSNRQVFFLEEDYSALLLSSIGAVCTYPGKYLDQTGMASNSSVLQDNNLYQDFSYVIKTTSDIEEYKETITALAHPAGFKMFGELSVENVFDSDTNLLDVINSSSDLTITDFDFITNDTLDNRITYTRTGTATRVNPLGLIETIAANTPRFDYNPSTLVKNGLLIEESRINRALYSSDFSLSTWVKSSVVVEPDAAVSPTGDLSASRIIETIITSSRPTRQSITITAGDTITFTVYGKEVPGSAKRYLNLSLTDTPVATNEYAYARFNLATGTVTGSGTFATSLYFAQSPTASIEAAGNGWYRCRITAVSNTLTTINSRIIITSSPTTVTGSTGGGQTYVGDGASGVYVWGAQVETGIGPTSYLPSTVSFTSRASSGTYFDSTGTLQTAATNVARNTYNPANLTVAPFLLLEAARTNSIRNNTMQGAVAGTPGTDPTNWIISPAGGSLTTKQIVGIGTENGIAYVDVRFVASGVTSASIYADLSNSAAASNGQTWTGSFYVKLAGGTLTNVTVRLSIVENDSGGNFLVGADGPFFVPSASALSTQRQSITRTNTNAATAFEWSRVRVDFAGAGDVTLRIGMPQLENNSISTGVSAAAVAAGGTGYVVGNVLTVVGGTGTASTLTVSTVSSGVITAVTVTTAGSYSVFPTSPVSVTGGAGTGATFNLTPVTQPGFATSVIPTSTVAVTRSADVSSSAAATRGADTVLVTGSNFDTWFNAREGTLYAEYVKNIITPTVSVASFENSATNFMRFISGTTAPASQRFDVLTSLSNEASLIMNGTETTGLITKIAGAYKKNDIAAAAYGVVSTDTAAVLPTGLNRLGIGTNYAGTYLNGYVRRLTYYPLRLSNAEIRTMTQPVGSVITTQDYSLNLDFIGNTVSIST